MKLIRSYAIWYGSGFVLLAITFLPVLWPGHFSAPILTSEALTLPIGIGLIAAGPLACWFALATTSLPKKERVAAWAFSLTCAGICEVVHYGVVDLGHYFGESQFGNNTVWQEWMHHGIIRLQAPYAPHSYRFLPDCIVAVFQALTGSFVFARISFRLLCNSLLYATVFRYARLYLTSISSIAVLLLLTMLYPIGILDYAGQFVDPPSHLSFAVCFYCLAAGYEPAFGPSLLVGIFAKESVLIMAICRTFYGKSRIRATAAALAYFAAGFAVAVGIRIHVNHGQMHYSNISGVDLGQVRANLREYPQWGQYYLATFGVLAPGAILGWKMMDIRFRATCVLVTASLVISSLFFSWLGEVRNLVPAFIPLAIVNLKYVESRLLPKLLAPMPTDGTANSTPLA